MGFYIIKCQTILSLHHPLFMEHLLFITGNILCTKNVLDISIAEADPGFNTLGAVAGAGQPLKGREHLPTI